MFGLDGASFFFEATLDETVSYIDRFDVAVIVAEDSFATISGATIDGTYGLWSDVAFTHLSRGSAMSRMG